MKIKTFTFEDNSVFKYNKNYENEQEFRKINGEYYYTKNLDRIDYMINNFIEEKNIEIIDIKVNSITKGNNPPTSILIYTLIYKEV